MKDRPCGCGGQGCGRCGCCEGVEALTPLPTANRPGLAALRYRVGTHATFFETMVAGLSSHRLADGRRPLKRLSTRVPDDPAVAFLDAWAAVADVLTFYTERIANEGYLLTATERRSVLELARLVGYRLRPGVAASVYLAFTLDEGFDLEIPAGVRARSLPGPGEQPQPFETDEAFHARAAWNALTPRLSRPCVLELADDAGTDASEGVTRFYLLGTATNLKVNDVVLFVCESTPSTDPDSNSDSDLSARPYTVHAVETDAAAGRTSVTYTPYGATSSAVRRAGGSAAGGGTETMAESRAGTMAGSGTSARRTATGDAGSPPLARLAEVVGALRKDPSPPPASRFHFDRPPGQTYSAAADLGPQLLTKFTPSLGDILYAAYANAPVTGVNPDDLCRVEAMRVKAAPFGHAAPLDLVYADNALAGRREWPLAELKATLDVRLSSPSSGRRVDEEFRRAFDPTSEFPFLSLEVSVSHAGGSTTLEPISPSDLIRVDPDDGQDDESGPLYKRSFAVGGVIAVVRARYTEETATEWYLRTLGVQFEDGPRKRLSRVHAGSLGVEATGVRLRSINRGEVVQQTTETGRRVAITLDDDGILLQFTHEETQFAADESARVISLDGVYDKIRPGGRVLVDRADTDPIIARVEQVRTVSRADYGISGRVTQLVLDQPWLTPDDTSLAVVRGTTVYAQNEELELAEEPVDADVEGDEIELDGLYDGLAAGRWLVVSGERTDVRDAGGRVVEGVAASELVMLAGVTQKVHTISTGNTAGGTADETELPGDTLHTRLLLSEPLAYAYKRDTVKINANVVKASHGETHAEVLGSGDASEPFQRFTLAQPGLTHLAAPTPKGVESTLDVRIDDVRWPEQETLLFLDGDDRGYETTTDDEGKTTVVFGDGRRGARLPTGVENVTAVYRSGIGKGGNVAAGQISVLATRPLGVKEVVNPQRASGGADPESRDQARGNAPLAVLALDRLVSLDDYAAFARTSAGIGKAAAVSLSDGRREIVHLTVAGADDAPIDRISDLYRNLVLALKRFGDPSVPFRVASREAVFIFLGARVKVGEDYLWEKVEPKIRTALLDAFGFDRRELGQDVLLSEVIGTVHGVEGVDYVDVDLFDGISEIDDASDPETLAAKLEAFAAAAGAAPTGAAASGSTPGAGTSPGTQPTPGPKQRLVIDMARSDPAADDPELRIRPAQLAYLNADLPDTLVLTEVTS